MAVNEELSPFSWACEIRNSIMETKQTNVCHLMCSIERSELWMRSPWPGKKEGGNQDSQALVINGDHGPCILSHELHPGHISKRCHVGQWVRAQEILRWNSGSTTFSVNTHNSMNTEITAQSGSQDQRHTGLGSKKMVSEPTWLKMGYLLIPIQEW